MMPARVVVNGSGIAGAAVAALLARAGHAVHLVERRPENTSHNGADILKPSGLAVIRSLGLMEELFAVGANRRDRLDVFHNGELIRTVHYGKQHDDIDYFVTIPRGCLVRMLVARLREMPGVTFHDHCAIDAVEWDDQNASSVTLNDGTRLACDLLIGTDGLSSQVRRLMGMRLDPVTYDAALIYGTIGPVDSVADGNKLYFDDRRGMMYAYPIERGKTRIVMTFPNAELNRMRLDETGALVRRRIGELAGDDRLDVIAGMDGLAGFRRIPVAMGNLPRYTSGNCALAGDAAHLIHPITGQGMNLALEDVAALAGSLEDCDWSRPGIAQALVAYERARHPINAAVIAYGDRMARNFHDRDSVLAIFDPRTQSSARKHLALDA